MPKKLLTAAAFALLVSAPLVSLLVARPAAAAESAVLTAVGLYNKHQYAAAADAFEAVLRTATPEARLYYYAALANRDSGRAARAKQLFSYTATNFPKTQEGAFAQALLGLAAGKATPVAAGSAGSTGTTSSTNGSAGSAAIASTGLPGGAVPGNASLTSAAAMSDKKRVKGARVFSEDEIAREGANGISQSGYPNCWFQASMSALAALPRGQRMLANMIHYGDGDTYIVRFPGDGVEYVVSEADCAANDIHNGALWASLLECAQIKKFPDNRGANGETGQSRLELGMGCITGNKAEEFFPKDASVGAISSFIGGAIRSNNPIIAGTYDPMSLGGVPTLTVGPHAYTIIGIDQSRNMIILRNPHGRQSRRFRHPSDPQHLNSNRWTMAYLK